MRPQASDLLEELAFDASQSLHLVSCPHVHKCSELETTKRWLASSVAAPSFKEWLTHESSPSTWRGSQTDTRFLDLLLTTMSSPPTPRSVFLHGLDTKESIQHDSTASSVLHFAALGVSIHPSICIKLDRVFNHCAKHLCCRGGRNHSPNSRRPKPDTRTPDLRAPDKSTSSPTHLQLSKSQTASEPPAILDARNVGRQRHRP